MRDEIEKKNTDMEKLIEQNKKFKQIIRDKALKSQEFALGIEENLIKEMDESFSSSLSLQKKRLMKQGDNSSPRDNFKDQKEYLDNLIKNLE